MQDKMDFGDFFNQAGGFRSNFKKGERISGTVVAVNEDGVFVDVGARSEGLLAREEVLDKENNITVEPGQKIDVYYLTGSDSDLRLTTRVSGNVADATLLDAYEGHIPVEGLVQKERSGGYEVRVSNTQAFCPYSQIDLHRQEPEVYLGNKFKFLVIEYSENGRNVVLSRRRLLEQEKKLQKDELKEKLSVGDVVSGVVRRIMPFGVFVDLGGIDGLVPMRELAWHRVENAEDIVSAGDQVEVTVLETDWEKDRVLLSLRKTQGDPWQTVAERYTTGACVEGRVVKLMNFGAFVEFEPGVEGLVHVSKFGRRINHPREVVSEGDLVEVSVENVDPEQRRISLSMEDTLGVEVEQQEDSKNAIKELPTVDLKPGMKIEGIVDGVADFGVFVRVSGRTSGLLHVSQLGDKGRQGALSSKFPEGSKVNVVVKEKKGDRIALALAENWERQKEEAEAVADYVKKDEQQKNDNHLGSLGDSLAGLDL